MIAPENRHESKTKFLNAALHVIRAKGYAATRVEDVCEAAELTKGSFFHHFDGKEALALEAADYWSETTSEFFLTAPYQVEPDPVARLLAYIDFRKSLLQGELAEFTCLVGTMVQEVYDSHPTLRDACNRSIRGHASTLVPTIEDAMRQRGMDAVSAGFTAESLALYTQASIQGAFVLAKASHTTAAAEQAIDHLHRYVELLFAPAKSGARRQPAHAASVQSTGQQRNLYEST